MNTCFRITRAALLIGSLACALQSQQAYAVSISGAITFKGGVQFDTGNIATADAVTAWTNTAVESRDGSFTAFVAVNAPVTFSAPWVFDPGAGKAALWSVGGFTFNLTSSTISFQDSTFLSIKGVGTITGNGFDPTTGSWSFSTQAPGAGSPAIFSFSGATGAPPGAPGTQVPDGGNTIALLGSGLVIIAWLRKRL